MNRNSQKKLLFCLALIIFAILVVTSHQSFGQLTYWADNNWVKNFYLDSWYPPYWYFASPLSDPYQIYHFPFAFPYWSGSSAPFGFFPGYQLREEVYCSYKWPDASIGSFNPLPLWFIDYGYWYSSEYNPYLCCWNSPIIWTYPYSLFPVPDNSGTEEPGSQENTAGCIDEDKDGFNREGKECGSIDCDDTNPMIKPGAIEVCGDGVDQDCDGGDVPCVPFQALPNVPQISDSPDDRLPSSLCYGCHSPHSTGRRGAAAKAPSIHGDDSSTPREHHPMGTRVCLGASSKVTHGFPRAPGVPLDLLNQNRELTCTSCHNGFHRGDQANNFLRWDFQNDSATFCCSCHTDKSAYNMGEEGQGHHQTKETSPVSRLVTGKDSKTGEHVQQQTGCGNCMFCHFIHDGQNRDGTQRGKILTPDLNALMRVPSRNLAWADKWMDTDLFDYEDMCFGCHGDSSIVKDPGLSGSLLLPPKSLDPAGRADSKTIHFSHRFAAAPESETTRAHIRAGGKFPLSDGLSTGTLDDYGVSAGLIYCGTCHDVHNNRSNPRSPYLRGTRSPYVAMGFCEECHTLAASTQLIDPLLNHPLGRSPDLSTGATATAWPREFIIGLSGGKGGVTFTPAGESPEMGRVICLTCHSVHAASTTFDGWADYPHSLKGASEHGNHGNLLVMDNYSSPSGSDICIRCHPDFSGIVSSPHDFSPGYRSGCQIGQKGVCSACHVPHNAAAGNTWNGGRPLLWARDLTAEAACFQQTANPAYTLGDTLLCYDCHSRCNDDPPLAAFGQFIPQDVASLDGPGGQFTGYYEDAPPGQGIAPLNGFYTGGHFIKSSMKNGITTGDKLACGECHDPHRGWAKNKAQNQAFIKEWLGGKANSGFCASRNMTYDDPSHGRRDNAKSRLICISCHGFSYYPDSELEPASLSFSDINPSWESSLPITSPPATVLDHSSHGVSACTDCHRHERVTVLCIDCHAFPPTTVGDGWSGPGDTDENYPGGAGAHSVHVFNNKYDCSTCHTGCLQNIQAGRPPGSTPDYPKARVDFNPLFGSPREAGEYPTKMGYPGLPPFYNPVEQVCFIGCHNPLAGDPDEAPNLHNASPAWSLDISNVPTATLPVPSADPPNPPLSCTGCHDFQTRLFTNSSDHHPNAITSLEYSDTMSKIKAVRQDCTACHNYVVNHTRGIVQLRDPDPYDTYPYNSGGSAPINNFCLSCHDMPADPDNPPIWFSTNGRVFPEHIIAPAWSLPCAHAVNPRKNLQCLDCHKYHGSNFNSMLKSSQPQLCYMNGCHPEKAIEFDSRNPSHHHVEGVLLGGVPTSVITCCDCHNPHHDTTIGDGHPVSDPYSKADLYPAVPLPQATLPVTGPAGFPVSGPPFYVGNVNTEGVPAADLFCLECHAPDIFTPPNPPWPGAPNISFELTSKYYDPLLTASNFFSPHKHVIAGDCSTCHLNKTGTIPNHFINGHYTHLKNGSCIYCHDPHGTSGTYAGETKTGGIVGVQRGHMLQEWLLADAAGVSPLPGGGGYQSPGAPSGATAVIASVDGASSCFMNDPLGGCHSITHIHNPVKVKTDTSCNTTPCHSTFTPLLIRQSFGN